MQKLYQFIKDWTLILAILIGISGYFIYVELPLPGSTHAIVNQSIAIVQPLLIFAMLLLTFTRIDAKQLQLRKWHLWLLAIQCGTFIAVSCILILLPHSGLRVILEGVMICMICPTATAGAVITRKLGGDVAGITTYTILINFAAAILIPSLVPFVHPNPNLGLFKSALIVLMTVFPLLLFPLFVAMLMKRFLPSLNNNISKRQELSFYLWAISLAIATAITTRSIVHTHVTASTILWLIAVSLICCIMQFRLGRIIGARYSEKITAGQSLGQKNTVFAIWLGYTFFTPVTSIAGGFYSIWHNVINSYQLYEFRKSPKKTGDKKSPE